MEKEKKLGELKIKSEVNIQVFLMKGQNGIPISPEEAKALGVFDLAERSLNEVSKQNIWIKAITEYLSKFKGRPIREQRPESYQPHALEGDEVKIAASYSFEEKEGFWNLKAKKKIGQTSFNVYKYAQEILAYANKVNRVFSSTEFYNQTNKTRTPDTYRFAMIYLMATHRLLVKKKRGIGYIMKLPTAQTVQVEESKGICPPHDLISELLPNGQTIMKCTKCPYTERVGG
jgi:hypothetical protein